MLGRHLGIFNDKIDVNVKEKEEKKNAISDILNQMQSADDV
nr:MAG TPA: Terminase small subunit [Caudoviricetes sp.]